MPRTAGRTLKDIFKDVSHMVQLTWLRSVNRSPVDLFLPRPAPSLSLNPATFSRAPRSKRLWIAGPPHQTQRRRSGGSSSWQATQLKESLLDTRLRERLFS